MQVLTSKSREKLSRYNNLTTTHDVSNVLKTLNKNINWKNSSMKFNKTINTQNLTQKQNIVKNIMTEEDLDKLFTKSKSKTRTETTNLATEGWSISTKSRDLANCVKFLRLEDQYDRLLTGLPQLQLDDYERIEELFQQN